jgi:large subunit ribosomal protein L11
MKQIKKILKLQIKGGSANPSPPIGPACGSAGINIMEFCKKFNEKTKTNYGKLLPVVIYVYFDNSFDFIIKKPTISVQLLEIVNKNKGSKEPNKNKIAKINIKDVKSIAEYKLSDLNCFTINAAISMVIGSAKSMGIEILKE